MKVLSLSLDQIILNAESVVAVRNARYGEVLEKYAIIVPSPHKQVTVLSSNTVVYGSGGKNKFTQLCSLLMIAAKLLKVEKYDVITSQDTYFLGLAGVVMSRIFGTGLEVQVLGIEKLTFRRKKLAQFTLSQAHSIRVLSRGLMQRLVGEFKIKPDRMMLVPIFVDVSSLGFNIQLDEQKRAELVEVQKTFNSTYQGRFNIVSVNRLVPIKNIPMQLEAIASLKDEFPQILLHIVGDGPDKQMLQTLVDDLGISSHVILHGPKFGIELSPFFTNNDCFVLTSDFEGYGMVIVEAATAGSTIVMTNVGCAGEVVRHEESALIIEPRDTRAFTDALRRLIADPALAQKLKEGAQRSVAELPSFDTVLQKYIASWKQAMEHKGQ
jgi:glycosyltransferase involved in cell wall biosynthesis